MGYGTATHREALNRLGVTAHHRRSFAPVRALLTDPSLTDGDEGADTPDTAYTKG